MSGNRPAFRVKYKSVDGTRYDVGTIWPSRVGTGYQISPEKRSEPGQYPKMRMSDAVRMCEEGTGFLDVWPVEQPQQREERPKEQRRTSGRQAPRREPVDDFVDDDIPF